VLLKFQKNPVSLNREIQSLSSFVFSLVGKYLLTGIFNFIEDEVSRKEWDNKLGNRDVLQDRSVILVFRVR